MPFIATRKQPIASLERVAARHVNRAFSNSAGKRIAGFGALIALALGLASLNGTFTAGTPTLFGRAEAAVFTSPYSGTPYSGSPVAIPGIIEAENFDKGGRNVAYYDRTLGNQGAVYRTAEDVEIYATDDTGLSSRHVVKGFESGEWLNYTVNVATAGNYNFEVRVSTAQSNAAYRILIDGRDITGRLTLPSTGGWHTYRWVTAKTNVPIAAGKHVVRIVAEYQWFGLNQIRISKPGTVSAAASTATAVKFFCTFPNSATDCGFREQAKVLGRAHLIAIARDGGTGVRLLTKIGDNNVSGSGSLERNDLTTTQAQTDCYEGREQWWAHSTYFPGNFVVPPSDGTYKFNLFFQFHHTGGTGQPNMAAEVMSPANGGLRMRIYGGALNSEQKRVHLGPIQKNVWYDFVYRVKWSSRSDGVFDAWLNGKKVLTHRGPTLYAGQGCYVKPSNYHSAFGTENAVIHDRIIRGSRPEAVSRTPLEGVAFGN